ncbi:MAG: 1,6-anhydro-N-acetylmuramyl-L-alanine amidase AmpD [Neisseria sp.]|nr:1,6-anhydro-N-acetylmuramyl-L-alanine amidase AmpD [Neisseria sp.]
MTWHNGFYAAAQPIPSPNHAPRPDVAVSLIVLHNISLPPFEYGTGAIDDLFLNRLAAATHPFLRSIADLRVSSHFLIERSGCLKQYVSCERSAYHAGMSAFRGRERCNDFSVGIELEGCDFEPFTDAQYAALLPLLHALCRHYPIDAICGHSDIAPQRKTDPGHFFEWKRLREVGLPVASD